MSFVPDIFHFFSSPVLVVPLPFPFLFALLPAFFRKTYS